jgi:hypothetical protein
MTTAPIHEWGRRLSDAIRAALDAGDLAAARRLALEGDGQARSLAKEYALMYRGLGITVRVLLRLLAETGSAEVAAVARRFRLDMERLMAPAAGDEPATACPTDGLDEELRRAARCLEAGEEQFDQEQARLADEVVLAIETGDVGRARACLDLKERGHYVPRHDRLIRFMAESFGWVLRRSGPTALLDLHVAMAEGQRRGFERWEQMSPGEFAWTSAYLLKQHMGRLEVREDAEKFTIEQSLCGSGGALVLRGAYAGPEALPYVEGAGPLTAGEPRLAVYCSHCPIWNGVAPLRWFGRPHWVFERPSRPDGSCTLHIYKRRDGAPATYIRALTSPGDGG